MICPEELARGRACASRYDSDAKGKKAMLRARLIARIRRRWCGAQTPEIRDGKIFPRSGMNWSSNFTSL